MYLIDETAFRFTGAGPGAESSVLLDAFKRYEGIIGLASGARASRSLSEHSAAGTTITSCVVTVASDDETLALETDESYQLTISAPTIQITANTVYGALYGLESLSHLVNRGLEVYGTTIKDFPRYQVRDVPAWLCEIGHIAEP